MRWKSCVLLPAAGRRTQLFHLIFTDPGDHLLVHTCRARCLGLQTLSKTAMTELPSQNIAGTFSFHAEAGGYKNYKDEKISLYVVWWSLLQLFLNCSAWLCLSSAYLCFAKNFFHLCSPFVICRALNLSLQSAKLADFWQHIRVSYGPADNTCVLQ